MCGYIDLATKQLCHEIQAVVSERKFLSGKVKKLSEKLARCKDKKCEYKRKYKYLNARVKARHLQPKLADLIFTDASTYAGTQPNSTHERSRKDSKLETEVLQAT